jgi:hopene-associated glycosyltransferase HpnB
LPARRQPAEWPPVAIVVPARDEAQMLPGTLPTLLAQDYPGAARLILVDDGSADGTAGLARRLAEEAAQSRIRVTVVPAGDPPAGWTGKLHALRRGVAEAYAQTGPAETAPAEFLLLTDADIAHGPGSLRALVEAATAQRLDLVSQMARLRVATGWERLVVPAFVYYFALLYPFRWCNRPRSRCAAAAGGCTLVRRSALESAGGLEAVRDAVIDDVAVARLVKRAGGRIWLGLADQVDSLRPYPRLADLWDMVARSAYAQLRHSAPLLAGAVAGLAAVFLAPPALAVAGLAAGEATAAALGAAAWSIMIGTYLPMLRYYRRPPPEAALLPFTAAVYLLMTVDSARRHRVGRGAAWKGRTYAGAGGRRPADGDGDGDAGSGAGSVRRPDTPSRGRLR